MEAGPDSPVYSDTSPAAPIDRPAYRLLPTRRPIPPPPKIASRDAVQGRRFPSGSVLDDNNSPVIIPAEGPWALNKRTSRLSPPLSPDAPEITPPPEAGIQIKLNEWLDVEKLRADGHMGEIIIDVAEVTPETCQHLNNKQADHQADKVLPSINVDDGYDADQSSSGSSYYRQGLTQVHLQLENDGVNENSSPPLLWPDPDVPLKSIETDFDYLQAESDREEAEEATQLSEADYEHESTHDRYGGPKLSALDRSSPLLDADMWNTIHQAIKDHAAFPQRLNSIAQALVSLLAKEDPDLLAVVAQPNADTDTIKAGLNKLNDLFERKQVESLRAQHAVKQYHWSLATQHEAPLRLAQEHEAMQIDSSTTAPEQIWEQATDPQSVAKQLEALRRRTPEHQQMFPEFEQAGKQNNFQLDSMELSLPAKAKAALERARPQLQPAIWAAPIGVPDVEIGNPQFSDDTDQLATSGNELFTTILRRDFDNFNGQPNLGIDAQLFNLPLDDPFVDSPPAINAEDKDVGMVLDMAGSQEHESVAPLQQTTALEVERQAMSTPNKNSLLADAIPSSGTLAPEPDVSAVLNGSPRMDVETSAQDRVMSELELPAQPMAATSHSSSSTAISISSVQKSTFSFTFKKAVETSSSDDVLMNLDSANEVDTNQTLPVIPAPLVWPSAPKPAPAIASVAVPSFPSHPLPPKPPKGAGLRSTYRKETCQDNSAMHNSIQTVKQRGPETPKNASGLQGLVEGNYYSTAAMKHQQPTMFVALQDPFDYALPQGLEGHLSEFPVQRPPQQPRGGQVFYNVETALAAQIHGPIPSYLSQAFDHNVGQVSNGYSVIDPVDMANYDTGRAGGQLGGHGNGHSRRGGQGDDRGGRGYDQGGQGFRGYRGGKGGWGRSMTTHNVRNQGGSRPTQANQNIMSLSGPPFIKNFSHGSSMLMSGPGGSHFQVMNQDSSSTPKQPGRPDTTTPFIGVCRPKGAGIRKQQPSETPVRPPPPPQQNGSFPDVPIDFSLQQLLPPSKKTKTIPQELVSPQKSTSGELYSISFVYPGNYEKALATLNDAKHREGKVFKISEEFDHRNGPMIKVTGPMGSIVRGWVKGLVPYGRQVASHPIDEW